MLVPQASAPRKFMTRRLPIQDSRVTYRRSCGPGGWTYGTDMRPARPQGCFKIGVLRTPGWEAAVGDGFAGSPPYTATRRLGRLAIADSLGLNTQTDAAKTLKPPSGNPLTD